MIESVNDLKVDRIEEVARFGEPTLLVNGNIFLRHLDAITYTCDKCGKLEIRRYRHNRKFHTKNILCMTCLSNRTRLEKYGVENFFQSKSIHRKAILKLTSDEANKKRKKTCIEKYGVDNVAKAKEVKEKMAHTNLERYGGIAPMNSDLVKNKLQPYWDRLKDQEYNSKVKARRMRTCIQKYGVEYVTQSTLFKEACKQTFLMRYGVEHPSQIEEVHLRMASAFRKRTKLKKYSSIFGILYYQSILELDFIRFCERNNLELRNGPKLEYILDGKNHFYFVDFETKDYIVEVKASHGWYRKDLADGKIAAKQETASNYATEHNKKFLFLLDPIEKDFRSLL